MEGAGGCNATDYVLSVLTPEAMRWERMNERSTRALAKSLRHGSMCVGFLLQQCQIPAGTI